MAIENKNKNHLISSIMAVVFLSVIIAGAVAVSSLSVKAAPLEGLYDNCNIGSGSCLDHLDRMGAGGFDVVLNYGSGSSGNNAAEMEAYLDRARQNGIKVIWDFNELAGKPDAADTVAEVVNAVKDHPATWGYCIGDETSSSKAASVRQMSDAIRVADVRHPVFVMGDYSTSSLGSFVDSADYLGLFIYPIGESEDSEKMVSEVGSVARNLRQFNSARGKRAIIALQAFNWAEQSGAPDWTNKRWPTRSEMREMRDQALSSNPDIILWFSYWHAAKNSDHWNDLVWAKN